MNPHDIIIKPIVTEQSMIDAANKKIHIQSYEKCK